MAGFYSLPPPLPPPVSPPEGGGSLGGGSLQRLLIHQTMLSQRRLIPCYAGTLNLVPTENGDVYPCEILTESFGNARNYDYDLGKVMQSGKAQQIIHSIQAKQCFCTHECYLMTNILFNPGLYHKLAKEYIQLR